MMIFNELKMIGSRAYGYGPSPIPSPLDGEISALIENWKNLPSKKRIAEISGIKDEQKDILLAYSERMASKSVRTGSKEDLFRGLLALGLDGWNNDWRDNLVLLALYADASSRIHISLESLFSDASKFMPLNVINAFRAFIKRNEKDKSLDAMGYEVSQDSDGFRYRRNW